MNSFPEQRRFVRVRCGFVLRLSGEHLVPTYGDISEGGARFTLDTAIGHEVELLAGELSAKAKVVAVNELPGRYTYRVQFTDQQAGSEVFDAALKAS